MKQIILTFLVFFSCQNARKTDKENFSKNDSIHQTILKVNNAKVGAIPETSLNKRDTIFNYWELILDTVTSNKNFKIERS